MSKNFYLAGAWTASTKIAEVKNPFDNAPVAEVSQADSSLLNLPWRNFSPGGGAESKM